ncbi:glycerol uptake facilitator protein [Halopolyspora algeriensis]|uniref:Glycerol uptake facilitator protein n=1 Tax=Halopolyspora algeriensis TaxID=1500506 RepID=A0A368VWF5_9ACTN|nr:MIP/aquaporin family protein [Halopolyspora algeriensis]RCW43743.1 glycerol uptake facilitator protein [Halopolyspora algeriensis]TQM47474.1 glycerol uptake facilitator protein [Halopolyspora algeriensis]
MATTEAPSRSHWRFRRGLGGEVLAEILGTFTLVLLGCGSVAVAVAALPESGRQAAEFGPANWLIIIWGWGFGVVFGVYVAGGISGAHINPAVTLAFALRRAFPWYKVVPYWLAQVVGAFLAAAVVYAVYAPAINAFNRTSGVVRSESLDTFAIFATFPADYFGGSWWGPLLDQIVGTAILVGLIFALIDSRNMAPGSNIGPFLIGMVVTVIGLTFGPNAGYAINPARDFGPRLWTYLAGWGDLAFPGSHEWFDFYFWIPIVGPLIGAVVGAVVYDLFIGQVLTDRPESEEGRVPE